MGLEVKDLRADDHARDEQAGERNKDSPGHARRDEPAPADEANLRQTHRDHEGGRDRIKTRHPDARRPRQEIG